MNGLWLSPLNTEVIFKTILHQNDIHVLDLGNNFLQNKGCQQLSKCLGTLKQLKVLNLSNNYITAEGLDAIFSIADNGEKKKDIINSLQLEELILSKNPLGNASIRILEKFLRYSKTSQTLKKLHISNCHLTRIEINCDLCFGKLHDFDISFNKIHLELLETALKKLNFNHLQHLNINYCLRRNPMMMMIAGGGNSQKTFNSSSKSDQMLIDLLENGNCMELKSLQLSGYHLTDLTMYKLIECLKNASNLQLLQINNNRQLSSTTFKFILDKLKQLRKLICENCQNIIDEQCLEQMEFAPSNIQLPEYISINLEPKFIDRFRRIWENVWKNRAKIIMFDTNVIFSCTTNI